MYCSKCGKELVDEAVVCTNCGCAVNGSSFNNVDKKTDEDTPNGGLNLLGFLIPIAGLVLYCINVSKAPKKAAQIGAFSLAGFIVGVLLLALTTW